MLRRIGVFVLLAMLLLTRGALVGHAHGIDESRWSQHIHFSSPFHASGPEEKESGAVSHGHHHGPAGHGHHHHSHRHQHPHPLKSDTLPSNEPAPHNDDMIVEIIVDDALAENVRLSFDRSADVLSWFMASMTSAHNGQNADRRPSMYRGHPPPGASTGPCPLHLLHLVLVI